MKNYEYILAIAPVVDAGTKRGEIDSTALMDEIRGYLDPADADLFDTLVGGFDAETLSRDFYLKALSSPCRFIREYFSTDLDVRNRKVRYLNRELGRPEGTDVMVLDEDTERVFEDEARVDAILLKPDLIERERGLDDYMWEKIEAMTELEVFTIDAVLGFVARLQIAARWLKLDPETGRELFRKLVDEIRNNKKSIEQ
ncbi:MAG: DUF2764 domain-containing protein [Bacteroidales bacterium]|nr:DUF2764 domain-containing protein [Bacteroidales bacterium]